MKLSWPIVGVSWIAEIRSRPTHCVRQLSIALHRRTSIWRRLRRPTGHPSGLTFHHRLSISVNCWGSCSCLYMHMLQLWWYMYDIMILCYYLDPNALFQILNCTEKCVWRLGALWTHWRNCKRGRRLGREDRMDVQRKGTRRLWEFIAVVRCDREQWTVECCTSVMSLHSFDNVSPPVKLLKRVCCTGGFMS